MDRINTPNIILKNGKRLFKDGDPNGDIPEQPTEVNAEWLNGVQEEICNVIEKSGANLSQEDSGQLTTAITSMIESKYKTPEKGDTGPQGVKGEQGTQGVKGERGPQGIRGERGLQGEPDRTIQTIDDQNAVRRVRYGKTTLNLQDVVGYSQRRFGQKIGNHVTLNFAFYAWDGSLFVDETKEVKFDLNLPKDWQAKYDMDFDQCATISVFNLKNIQSYYGYGTCRIWGVLGENNYTPLINVKLDYISQ